MQLSYNVFEFPFTDLDGRLNYVFLLNYLFLFTHADFIFFRVDGDHMD